MIKYPALSPATSAFLARSLFLSVKVCMRQSEAINTTKWVNENKKWYLIIMGASILMFTQAAIKVSGPTHCQSWLSDQWEACIIHQSTNQRTGETREKTWQFRENWLALTHKFCQFVFVFGIVVFHRISVYPLKPNIEKKTYFLKRIHVVKPISENQMTWNSFIMTWCCWKTWWGEYLISSCQRQVISLSPVCGVILQKHFFRGNFSLFSRVADKK